jgi:hypothetical protein
VNGNFIRWVTGVVGGLVLLAISGGVIFDRDMARQLAEQGETLRSIQYQIDIFRADNRARGSFNRDDADRELHQRDLAIERLERRVTELERKRP